MRKTIPFEDIKENFASDFSVLLTSLSQFMWHPSTNSASHAISLKPFVSVLLETFGCFCKVLICVKIVLMNQFPLTRRFQNFEIMSMVLFRKISISILAKPLNALCATETMHSICLRNHLIQVLRWFFQIKKLAKCAYYELYLYNLTFSRTKQRMLSKLERL